MQPFNGTTMKVVRGTIATVTVTAILIFLGSIGKQGLKAMIQNEAKVAVKEVIKDTTIQNSSKIDKLEKLVTDNEKRDNDIHPQVRELQIELKNLTANMKELKRQMIELKTAQDKMLDLLIKEFQK